MELQEPTRFRTGFRCRPRCCSAATVLLIFWFRLRRFLFACCIFDHGVGFRGLLVRVQTWERVKGEIAILVRPLLCFVFLLLALPDACTADEVHQTPSSLLITPNRQLLLRFSLDLDRFALARARLLSLICALASTPTLGIQMAVICSGAFAIKVSRDYGLVCAL